MRSCELVEGLFEKAWARTAVRNSVFVTRQALAGLASDIRRDATEHRWVEEATMQFANSQATGFPVSIVQ